MRTLAVVPARGGSKRIPGKNLRYFRGKPLVQWAIEVAKETCDEVVVSSDDRIIRGIAQDCGVISLIRPAELAQDDTPMLPVVQHAIKGFEGDVVVVLQPTQPFRMPHHVLAALKLLQSSGADSVASVVQIPAHYSPEYACAMIADGLLHWFGGSLDGSPTRRQQVEPAFSRDGTVYAIRRRTLDGGDFYGRCEPLIIPASESVNLDTEEDWQFAEFRAQALAGVT